MGGGLADEGELPEAVDSGLVLFCSDSGLSSTVNPSSKVRNDSIQHKTAPDQIVTAKCYLKETGSCLDWKTFR